MKERIEAIIKTLKEGSYDQESVHQQYDRILQDYIKSEPHDAETRDLMLEAIELEKDFWWA